MRYAVFVMALALTACVSSPQVVPVAVKTQPLNVNIAPECLSACGNCGQPSLLITSDPDSALVSLQYEHTLRSVCAGELSLCDTRHKACAEALRRAQIGKAIQ